MSILLEAKWQQQRYFLIKNESPLYYFLPITSQIMPHFWNMFG